MLQVSKMGYYKTKRGKAQHFFITCLCLERSERNGKKYENGKWKYKTVFKGNENVEDACVCGGKILIKANYYDEAKGNGFIKFYIMDLNGKNKKLLHEGEAVG